MPDGIWSSQSANPLPPAKTGGSFFALVLSQSRLKECYRCR